MVIRNCFEENMTRTSHFRVFVLTQPSKYDLTEHKSKSKWSISLSVCTRSANEQKHTDTHRNTYCTEVKLINLDMLPRDYLCQILILNIDILQGRSLFWLSSRCSTPWINRLPPVRWYSFWRLHFYHAFYHCGPVARFGGIVTLSQIMA